MAERRVLKFTPQKHRRYSTTESCSASQSFLDEVAGEAPTDDKMRETLRSLVKSFGVEKIKVVLEEISIKE